MNDAAPPRTIKRSFASVMASIVLGCLFGGLSANGMGLGYVAEIAGFFGAIVGLVTSPLLVCALQRGPWLLGATAIAVPTAGAAYVSGAMTSPNGGPFVSLIVSCIVYALMAIGWRVHVIRRYPQFGRGCCQKRGYELRGITSGICPECGTARPS